MSERHYLLKVMGLSATPRILTMGLTMVSFPLMVRALGPRNFGVVVFIGAVTAVLESFVDFGVSSAAGKAIASTRESGLVPLALVVRRWARLQATVAMLGLVPLLLLTYVTASTTSQIKFSMNVVVLLVLATWITISLNFVRAALTSLLAFRSLATVDTFESVVRSASWIGVAYLLPTTMGLALANVATAVCASSLGALLLWRTTLRCSSESNGSEAEAAPMQLTLSHMLHESGNFLWLRLATRVFLSLPILLFGRLFGSEVVGVVGAFAKIVDLASFPFSVIGNALAVRAAGVVARGTLAAKSLWDVVARVIAMSVVAAATVYLSADLLARVLTPGSIGAAAILRVLSVTVVTTAISAVVAPMSDYVGALRARNVLLTWFSLLQAAAIWIGGRTLGGYGALGAYVIVLCLMNWRYVVIALGAFFPSGDYELRAEVTYFLGATAVALLLTTVLDWMLGLSRHMPTYSIRAVAFDVSIFWSMVLAGIALHSRTKQFFLTTAFFDFQPREG